ncbi:restriction endonuclease subunit S [Vibrio rumoiensis]|uniref:Restriction endonuclease subunit S n=1 Tax=Vibrio rumoiensis TaxID=76258 RepID=A0ABW7ITG6_9VIBR
MEGNTFKLGNICRIELGKTPSRSNKKYWDEDKSSNNIWLSIADLPLSIKPVVVDSKEYITDEGAALCKMVPKNTLIVSFKLSLGRLAITGCDLYTNEAIAALYINENVALEQDYLYWYLTFFDWDAAAGSDIKVKGKTLNKAKLKEILIPIPSIPEQKRIVALLDTVFADLEQTRAKTEQNLKNARELFDSYLQQIFSQKGEGWVESKLGDLLHVSSSKRIYAKDWTDSGVPFFGGKEIVKLAKYGKADSNSFISEEKYMEYASQYDMPQEGDILMTARGTIGVGYIVRESDKFYYKDGNIISLRQKSPTNPDFILYAFKSHKIIDQIKELTGTTVSHLPLNKAKELVINIPSYQVQNEIVLQIKKMEGNVQQVISIYEEKLTSIDELKKSILQKAFSGELTHD